mmetsp:Transcript_27997/g.66799  ORF Transcript_27997/g.66799 Transcript_27997/m.66799 type:complete len:248 (+) Transcript_27997:230-973(+)
MLFWRDLATTLIPHPTPIFRRPSASILRNCFISVCAPASSRTASPGRTSAWLFLMRRVFFCENCALWMFRESMLSRLATHLTKSGILSSCNALEDRRLDASKSVCASCLSISSASNLCLAPAWLPPMARSTPTCARNSIHSNWSIVTLRPDPWRSLWPLTKQKALNISRSSLSSSRAKDISWASRRECIRACTGRDKSMSSPRGSVVTFDSKDVSLGVLESDVQSEALPCFPSSVVLEPDRMCPAGF